jgi:hypothetical protein
MVLRHLASRNHGPRLLLLLRPRPLPTVHHYRLRGRGLLDLVLLLLLSIVDHLHLLVHLLRHSTRRLLLLDRRSVRLKLLMLTRSRWKNKLSKLVGRRLVLLGRRRGRSHLLLLPLLHVDGYVRARRRVRGRWRVLELETRGGEHHGQRLGLRGRGHGARTGRGGHLASLGRLPPAHRPGPGPGSVHKLLDLRRGYARRFLVVRGLDAALGRGTALLLLRRSRRRVRGTTAPRGRPGRASLLRGRGSRTWS